MVGEAGGDTVLTVEVPVKGAGDPPFVVVEMAVGGFMETAVGAAVVKGML